ncbi:MAG TPA: hypothetical protein ENJ33_06870 [Thiothrix sp.]|nr:hypothetical protein [Thiothrix sp.]
MANLQIKGMDDVLYAELKALASAENRSVSQQVLYLIRHWLSHQEAVQKSQSAAEVLLELSGSWQDDRDSEDIIEELKVGRVNSRKLTEGF